ncbi:MAG: SDR family NAD(P)-dependent oxidoreductase [Pseudomonadota bacterium]
MSVLITGANRGIGHALAQLYRAQGDDVLGTARARGAADLVADLSDPASITAMAAALAGRPIGTLVCNAGVYLDKGQPLEDGFAPALWAETFAVNVTGVFLTIQALLPNLRAVDGARIAIISSQMASSTRARGGSYIYRASKAAVLNLGRNLATDLAPEGIAVGIYHPGWVQTDMGTQAADIDVATSVEGLMTQIDALSMATTGVFASYDGSDMPY